MQEKMKYSVVNVGSRGFLTRKNLLRKRKTGKPFLLIQESAMTM